MDRMTIACAVCALCLPAAARGQEKKEEKTVVRFAVAAKAAPKPALRYQLLPEAREIEPGTAVQQYLKCFMEQHNFYRSKEAVAEREKWLTMPLGELPLDKLRGYGGNSLRCADAASRMERVEWQILPDLKRNGINTLLPEIQQLRELAAALKVRLRGEIADKRFDAAVGTIKTLYKLGQNLGKHPTLICNLVGVAIVSLTTGCVEEMLQQPGCPNLYWAFVALPTPLVSGRDGAQGERMFLDADFALVDPTEPMSAAKVEKAQLKYDSYFEQQKEKTDFRGWVAKRCADAKGVEAARARLIESGLVAAEVKKMPATQVVLLDEQREYRERADDELKWMTQPFWAFEARPAEGAKRKPAMFDSLLPNTSKIRRAITRVDQRVRMLHVLEAIRLHAAENKGELPTKLEDVGVTLPVDPVSGKAFVYAVADGKATLRGTPPRGEEKTATYNVVYEVTIVK